MTNFEIWGYADIDAFREDWQALGYSPTETERYWTVLEELESGELLIQLPEWLADKKTGFVDGATPTAFVGTIETETAKAIQVPESAAARPLSQHASRIQPWKRVLTGFRRKTVLTRIEWRGSNDGSLRSGRQLMTVRTYQRFLTSGFRNLRSSSSGGELPELEITFLGWRR